jgi:N-acetylmuramoyl-L-alanine amidase
LLFGIAPVAGAVEYKEIGVCFGGGAVAPEVKSVQKDGVKFINLTFLNNYLHVISKWDPDTGNIELHFEKLSFTLTEDSIKYSEAGVEKLLSAPPFEKDEQLWLPVDFLLRLGLVIKEAEPDQLRLDWAENYLIGIENIIHQNRPAFLLIGSKTFTVKDSNLLQKPDRLMVDFTNLKIHPAFDNQISGNQMVTSVRIGARDGDNLRLVFDLSRLTGYKIVRDPNQEGQLIIVFNGYVTGLKFIRKEAVRKVQINTSLPTEYRITTISKPNRILIDLEGVTLDTTVTQVAGDAKWVSSVRIAQFDPQTVRVVLDLLDQTPCYVIHPADNFNLIEVRTVQTINEISWSDEGGGQLTIAGDSELVKTVRKLKNPEQLQVDLNYFQFAPGLITPLIKKETIKGVKLIALTDTKVRIEVYISQHVLYDIQVSSDQRRLVIRFQTSSLLNKILVLDAGHGGVDPGTCGSQGTREKDFTLDVTMRLKELLEDAGAYVILTRSDDSYISLFERPLVANINCAALFISIHCNSYSGNRNIRGIEIYYHQNPAGKILAGQVMSQLIPETKLSNRGIRANNYAVLVESLMPSILVELGYLSNYAEETLLNHSEFKENASIGIFQGIVAYYQK